jgi:hypothetical protein
MLQLLNNLRIDQFGYIRCLQNVITELLKSSGNRLRVFENRVQRRKFGPKRDEVPGGRRKLHEELHNLDASPNIIRMII